MDPKNLEKDRTYYLAANDGSLIGILYTGMLGDLAYSFVIEKPSDDSEFGLRSGQNVTFPESLVRNRIFEDKTLGECRFLPDEIDSIRTKLEMEHDLFGDHALNENLLRKENRLRFLQEKFPEEFV